MRDKFTLTREQNVFLAKKKWDENIYCGMKMENRNVTFPETQTILSGVNVGSVRLDDIQAILNMRDAWRFLIAHIDDEPGLDFLCGINERVSRNESLEWGVLRTGTVGISGTNYRPPVPRREQAESELNALVQNDRSATEKALDIFLWAVRAQLFWDGNKRTSLLAGNALLVRHGRGLLTIAERDIAEFNALLTAYYDSADGAALKQFLYENAIDGIVTESPTGDSHRLPRPAGLCYNRGMIQRTIEVPANRRLMLDIPPEVPDGQVVLTFTPAVRVRDAAAVPPIHETLQSIWTICKNARVTVDGFLAERSRENEREEAGSAY